MAEATIPAAWLAPGSWWSARAIGAALGIAAGVRVDGGNRLVVPGVSAEQLAGAMAAHETDRATWLAASRVAAIKAEARRRIVARYPEWQQQNMTARGVELTRLLVENGAWTEDEAAQAAALQTAWDWIKQVRAHSNALEDDDEADIESGWPE